jgi:hypothetical protein
MKPAEFYETQTSWDRDLRNVDIWTKREVEKMLKDYAAMKCRELRKEFKKKIRDNCPVYIQTKILQN